MKTPDDHESDEMAATLGITTAEYRRRLALQRIAELRAQLAEKRDQA